MKSTLSFLNSDCLNHVHLQDSNELCDWWGLEGMPYYDLHFINATWLNKFQIIFECKGVIHCTVNYTL